MVSKTKYKKKNCMYVCMYARTVNRKEKKRKEKSLEKINEEIVKKEGNKEKKDGDDDDRWEADRCSCYLVKLIHLVQ